MILSYHPCFSGDRQILCAGREPDKTDLGAIRSARAVILPQGCGQALYRMARENCAHVFPNYDVRFAYPRKSGQIRLFHRSGVPHPSTEFYPSLEIFTDALNTGASRIAVRFPFVFKFDWGGEGRNVLWIPSPEALNGALDTARRYERTGQKGFLVQEYIPAGNRVLRVVVIGARTVIYWRVLKNSETAVAGLAAGGVIDTASDSAFQKAAGASVRRFCDAAGINLAGFDILSPLQPPGADPVFLEINYFFGRRGLGGSRAYYRMLIAEIERWIDGIEAGPPMGSPQSA
jgi:ribosomal protein S6--L-glutamate ligase